MPRVAPLYRFIKMHYLESRKMRFGLTMDAARDEALEIWDTMTNTDRRRFKERLCLFDTDELSEEALSYYQEIESSPDVLLAAISEDAVFGEADLILKSPTTPLFFLEVFESMTFLGYPEEMSIVRFSLANGVESYFHALFKIKGLDATIGRTKSKLHVIAIRDDPNEGQNLRDLATDIRNFTGGGALYTKHSQMRSSHSVMQLLNRVDVNFEHPMHEVFVAEELLRVLVRKRMSERAISRAFERVDKFSSSHFACDFHQACGRAESCTLLNSLLMTQTFGEIFAKLHNIEKSYFSVGFRPKGILFTGSGKKQTIAKSGENKSDGIFKVPRRK